MNRRGIAFGIGIVLAVLAVLTAPAMAYGMETWFVPENSTGVYGETDILVYINMTESVGETVSGEMDIYYDKNCVNIVTIDQSMSPFSWNTHNWFNDSYHGSNWWPWLSPTHTCVRIQWDNPQGPISAGNYTLCVLTLHCNCSSGCSSDLLQGYSEANNEMGDEITGGHKFHNGTYTCIASQETFSKDLVEGWNLISLPLTADNMTVSSVFSSVADKYDAIYSYDAETHSWVALGADDTLENGVGYFIHMTENGTWTYQGSAYLSMSIPLEPGLNLVGWVNTSASLLDALSSIEGDYWYVARWNATTQKFEVYVPDAPPVFNDFNTMERGEGYFIAAKTSCTLTYP